MQVVATDYVQNYVRHISDGSRPKAEYMRHFEATRQRALGRCDALTTGPGSSKVVRAILTAHLVRSERP